MSLVLSTGAAADVSFCGSGPGAGECASPGGVAVRSLNGEVFVADRGNNRVNVFDSAGDFLRAFGWGVADGVSAEAQVCTTTCFKGLAGGGAGEFSNPSSIAVDNNSSSPAFGNVYVFEQARVQELTPAGEFLRTWGGGVVTGGAAGRGDLASGSTTVTNVKTTKKAFATGQTISGAGIPAGTKILALGAGTMTLSNPASASGASVALSVAEGAGNVSVNEVQVLTINEVIPGFPKAELTFTTPDPSPSTATVEVNIVPPAPANGPGSLQAALEGSPNIGAGNVAVSGPTGGPYTIEFKGTRFADTDVEQLFISAFGSSSLTTTQNGASAPELCSAANAADCTAGVQGNAAGAFGQANAAVAVGPGGSVFTVDSSAIGGDNFASRVQEFDPMGAPVDSSALPGNSRAEGLAVDSSGDSYVAYEKSVVKYDPSGTPIFTLKFPDGAGPIAVDASDNLLIGHREAGFNVIAEFDPSGSPLLRFGYGALGNLGGIAPYSSPGGDVYASEPAQDRVRYLSFPQGGPILAPGSVEVSGNSNTKATLNAQLNPEGEATEYHFEFVDQASFEGSGFASAKSTPTASVGSSGDFALHSLSATIGCLNPAVEAAEGKCLTPETVYHYRIVASNPSGPGEGSGEGAPFKTLAPLEITATFATAVGPDAAQLHAVINPLGIPASGYFEYVDDASFQVSGFDGASQAPDVSAGASPIDLGSAEAEKAVSTQISGLTADTTYHYRFLASNTLTPAPGILGPERTLHTFPTPASAPDTCPNATLRTGPSANLPNCRAYEMVSPVAKGNGDIAVRLSALSFPAGLDQSAGDGNSLAYSSEKSFGDAISAPYTSQYIASRGAGGWASHGISPPRESKSFSENAAAKFDLEYKAFAADLSSGWLLHDSDPMLDECAVAGYLNLYRHRADGSYEALTTAKPTNEGPGQYWPELQGVSADGSHAVFAANGKLTSNAANIAGESFQLYEHVAGEGCGELRLVSVLPNGKASQLSSSVGVKNISVVADGRENTVANAVSADGSRIFWTAATAGPGALYVRIDGSVTVQLSAGPARFWTAAADGSKAIYTVGENLYEFDVASKTQTLIAGGSPGVAAASEDASRVYFVSSEALGGEGEAGKQNLYLHAAGGANTYIGTLSATDFSLFYKHAPLSVVNPSPPARGVRTTADGGVLSFSSDASLSDYDNRDAESGAPTVELYRYEAGTGALSCVSCDPSGARPKGREINVSGGKSRQVAALLPAWENQLYAPRALSADGKRLFFESFLALVPRDSNGAADVYEWEQAQSAKECDEMGAELFVESAGGCLSLISTGQSPSDSRLVDASPSGSDVFIKTASSLVPQDSGLVDIYDVREGGGFPPPTPEPPPCEGEACQGSAVVPNDPTPSSSSFHGDEGRPKRCTKGKVLRKGRCVDKKKQSKKQKHGKQASHKGRAGR